VTDIEQKALALVNEVAAERGTEYPCVDRRNDARWEALCRAIEQHEAFRQEVSDKIEAARDAWPRSWSPLADALDRLIIAKPDPLVEAMKEWWDADGYADIETFRAAIEKRGGKIVWGEG